MLSNRIKGIRKSIFYEYHNLVEEREKSGIKFYKLNMGQPDFDTSKIYFESLSSFRPKTNSYSEPAGLNSLRKSVSEYYNKNYNKNLDENNIVVTQGASDAVIKLLYCICDSDDEIILIEPFFADYGLYCDILNIKIKTINYNDIKNNNIESVITKKTKAILFANPNNPDGRIMDEDSINNIITTAKKHNLMIISDEVYSGLIYNDEYISLSNYLSNNVVVVDSASKKLNLCGSRIGYIISNNKELIEQLTMFNDCRISISNVEQYAVSNMLKEADKIIEKEKEIYKSRMDLVIKKLKGTKIKYDIPSGGITMLLELPFNTKKYIEWLIKEYEKDKKTILVVPGDSFYASKEGKNKIRICLTSNIKDLEEAIDLLIDSCNKYRRK